MPIYKSDQPTKDGRRYYYVISKTTNGSRKQIKSKLFKTRKEAVQAESEKMLELNKLPSKSITFGQLATVFLADLEPRVKPQSILRNRNQLRHFLKSLGDTQIDKLTLEQYQDALLELDNYTRNGKPLTNKYKNKVIATFKRLIAFGNKRYGISTDIPSKIDNYKNERKKEMKFITYEEFKHFISVVDNPIFKSVFITLYFMGLRCGEMNGLQWQDIDFSKRTMTIRRTVDTKHKVNGEYYISSTKTEGSERTLPLPQIVYESLLDIKEHQYKPSENVSPVFVFGGLSPIPETTIQKNKNKYFKKAGMTPIRIHDFRHSCASYLINKNATPLLVSKWLGHASVTMTLNTYSHLWKNELENIVNLIDNDTIVT